MTKKNTFGFELGKAIGGAAFGLGKFVVEGLVVPAVVGTGSIAAGAVYGLAGDTVDIAVSKISAKLNEQIDRIDVPEGGNLVVVLNGAELVIPNVRNAGNRSEVLKQALKEHFSTVAKNSFPETKWEIKAVTAEEAAMIRARAREARRIHLSIKKDDAQETVDRIEAAIESKACTRCGQFETEDNAITNGGLCEGCISELDLMNDEDYMQQ